MVGGGIFPGTHVGRFDFFRVDITDGNKIILHIDAFNLPTPQVVIN